MSNVLASMVVFSHFDPAVSSVLRGSVLASDMGNDLGNIMISNVDDTTLYALIF